MYLLRAHSSVVEQSAHNRSALGSNPSGPTIFYENSGETHFFCQKERLGRIFLAGSRNYFPEGWDPLIRVRQVYEVINELAPWDLAETWDQVGLQIGRMDQPVRQILVAVDFNRLVLEEALQKKADGVIVHHPLIFKPVTKINLDSSFGQDLAGLIKNDLFLIAAHTNIDKAEKGLNHYLAELLGLINTESLEPVNGGYCKVTVFTPEDFSAKIYQAMASAGAGEIGAYTGCSFGLKGTGTFQPGQGTDPFIGQIGKSEEVPEIRLEMIAPQRKLSNILKAILTNHPYEEPAIDIYPLLNSTKHGLGRVGELPEPFFFEEYCSFVKKQLPARELRIQGDPRQKIKRVAVCSGSGGKLMATVAAQGADLFITGDLNYHDFLLANEYGLAVIDAGHWTTEHCFILLITGFLEKIFSKDVLKVIPSLAIQQEPYQTL